MVVNSCSVTATADQGTRQAIRRIARTNAGARIVATGCYASRAAEEVAALPGVAAVVPNADKDVLVARILEAVEPTTAVRFGDGDGACGAMIPPGGGGRTAYTPTGADGVRRSVGVLHHPIDARPRPQRPVGPGARQSGLGGGRRIPGAAAHRRPPSAPTAAI